MGFAEEEEEEEVTVFVDTNLGTRIAMSVHIDITSFDFKRKFEITHTSCLPSFGEIRVHGLMVKRMSQFYYLAESMPIKYVFRDNQKPWFIHVVATLVKCSIDKSLEGVIESGEKKKKKKKKSRTKPMPKHDSRNLASLDKREFLGPSTSETGTVIQTPPLSVPRADSECFNSFVPKTPEKKLGDSVSKSETVSKKLTVAANNIRMQGKSHLSSSLSSSIFRSKTRKMRSLDGKTINSVAKFLVFDGTRSGFM